MFSKSFYVSIFMALSLCILAFIYIQSQPVSVSEQAFPIEVVINYGDSLPVVAANLYRVGVIRSEALFRIALAWVNLATDIRPGVYIFDKPQSIFDIINKFALHRPDRPAMPVTIPEGFTDTEIIDRLLVYLPNLDKDKFLKIASAYKGQLFPETYFLQPAMTEQNIVDLMHGEFIKHTSSISVDKANFQQIHIMASVIEGEAGESLDEKKIIAGILYKRLDQKLKLQVDVAKETYKVRGLPKEPINNPGLDSIMSAISPIESKYMYYLHDNNGMIHYATLYSEHLKNIKKYLK